MSLAVDIAAAPEDSPIVRHRDAIIQALSSSQSTIIRACLGSGKSLYTGDYLHSVVGSKVLCTQPRLTAAYGLASSKSGQMGTRLGAEICYHAGSVDVQSCHTFLLYIATGALALMNDMFFPIVLAFQ